MATNGQASPLLALPVELIGRIADSLTPESLLMLRLTCKILEHSTYDLFAKTFFEQRFCCIYYEPRWLLLNNVLSSRLGSRLREVTFTERPLEFKRYTDVQLAPNRFDKDMRTAQSVAEAKIWRSTCLQIHGPTWPITAIFHRVFHDFKRLAPRTLIKFNFLTGSVPTTDLTVPLIKADTLLAAVTAGVAIDTLKLAAREMHSFMSVLMYLESELIASTKSLKCFQLRADNNEYDPQFAITVLKSTNDLRELATTSLPPSTTTAILGTADFSGLTTLRIEDAFFFSEQLVANLSVCHSMLHLHLSDVRLSSGERAWPNVLRTLASMSQLHHLSFCDMWSFDLDPLGLRDLVHGTTTQEGKMVEYQGREQVAAGLEELLGARSLFVNGPWGFAPTMVGGCRTCGHDAE